jgi:predicted nucleic acid-binding protein
VELLKIVINSSPLIFLVKLQFLELFLDSDDEFYIPSAVLEEIHVKSDEVSQVISPLVEAGKIMVVSTRLLSLVNRLNLNLGLGESEAISLATELQADFIILDDRAARKIAINLGLNVKGTLAIIKKLIQENKIIIDNLDEFYQRLRQINFRVSRSIFDTIFTR